MQKFLMLNDVYVVTNCPGLLSNTVSSGFVRSVFRRRVQCLPCRTDLALSFQHTSFCSSLQ